MTAVQKTHYSQQEYLEMERAAPYKSEYFQGEIFNMAGATFNHNQVCENLSVEFGTFLKKSSCRSLSRDMRVHIPGNSLYTYPDILIVCGQLEFLDTQKDTLLNPVVLIEVLSSSTEAYDRGDKFELYRSIPTFKEYVLVSSQRVKAEVHRRAEQGFWYLAEEGTQLENTITIQSVGCTLSLDDIYSQTENLTVMKP